MMPPPFLTHDLLEDMSIAHGFFTRHGGVSEGVYDSLNCGLSSGDDKASVERNRHLAATALGGGDDKICGLYQIHSGICHVADVESDERPQGDGLVTNKRGAVLAVLTADCAPILLADRDAGVIGVAHAGWRGAMRGIVASTLEAMTGLGARLDSIRAVIGPAIQQDSYEVGSDLRGEVLSHHAGAEDYFAPDGGGKWRFDLTGFVGSQLASFEVRYERMMDDTYSDVRFFSHRKATHAGGADTGRLVSMIRLKS